MNDKKWLDAVDGLYAWYTGCTDSGIRDPMLTEEVRRYWDKVGHLGQAKLVMKLAKESCSKEAAKQGYGGDDLRRILNWIYDENFR